MEPSKIKTEFLERLSDQSGLTTLFEYIPDIHFWVKNTRFQFVMGNQAVSEKCGCVREEEIIGKTDYDFFPQELADEFRKDDASVIKYSRRIMDRIELVPNEDGTVDWYITNKIPLFSRDGTVIGIAGTTRRYRKADQARHPHGEMGKVLEYISCHYMHQLKKATLAGIAGLSINQFDKKCKKALGLSPDKFINAVRVRAACKILVDTRKSIKTIAYDNGFCNQSYFSKQFKLFMGMTPKQYRDKFYKGD